MSIADLRMEYTQGGLLEAEAGYDPFDLFQRWFDQAQVSGIHEPNAMTLATVSAEGHPTARIILLKGFDSRGFTFFTNYESRKGHELAANPHASLILYWGELQRQVRIEGIVSKVTPAESDAYHQSRPRGSQLGAWTSEQSQVISGREILESRLRELESQYPDGPIPRPPHWGGFRLSPDMIEFWQGRPSRLHDRLRYSKIESGWRRERLAP